ncbi:MAG: hypothetical protein KF770_10600 [Anaerolineae bacterium]|nr:hypothetical protein [Anaerolineae bacterium]
MSTVHPTPLAVNGIVESIYWNKRTGVCDATVITANGFERRPITLDDYQTIAARLYRFVRSSGPTCVYFDTAAQQKWAAKGATR